jgi:hypothetical protein
MGAKAVSRVGSVTGLVDLGDVRAIVKAVKALPSREKAKAGAKARAGANAKATKRAK